MSDYKDIANVVAGLAESGSKPKRGKGVIDPAVSAGNPIGQSKGTGYASQSSSTGGGVASPLVEVAYSGRTYHPESTITSTDGIFSFSVKRIKTIDFKDANNSNVQLELKAP